MEPCREPYCAADRRSARRRIADARAERDANSRATARSGVRPVRSVFSRLTRWTSSNASLPSGRNASGFSSSVSACDLGPAILAETEIQAADASGAIREAVEANWPRAGGRPALARSRGTGNLRAAQGRSAIAPARALRRRTRTPCPTQDHCDQATAKCRAPRESTALATGSREPPRPASHRRSSAKSGSAVRSRLSLRA